MKKVLLSMVAISIGAVHGYAQSYVFVEGGNAQADLSTSKFKDSVSIWKQDPQAKDGTVSSDKSSIVYRIGYGYKFSNIVAAELSYENLGEYDAGMNLLAQNPAGDTASTNIKESVSVKGAGINIIGNYPITSTIKLLGGAGVTYLRNERKNSAIITNYNQNVQHANVDESNWKLSPTLRLGAEIGLTDNISARGWYSRYFNATSIESSGKFDINTFNAGILISW